MATKKTVKKSVPVHRSFDAYRTVMNKRVAVLEQCCRDQMAAIEAQNRTIEHLTMAIDIRRERASELTRRVEALEHAISPKQPELKPDLLNSIERNIVRSINMTPSPEDIEIIRMAVRRDRKLMLDEEACKWMAKYAKQIMVHCARDEKKELVSKALREILKQVANWDGPPATYRGEPWIQSVLRPTQQQIKALLDEQN